MYLAESWGRLLVKLENWYDMPLTHWNLNKKQKLFFLLWMGAQHRREVLCQMESEVLWGLGCGPGWGRDWSLLSLVSVFILGTEHSKNKPASRGLTLKLSRERPAAEGACIWVGQAPHGVMKQNSDLLRQTAEIGVGKDIKHLSVSMLNQLGRGTGDLP